MDVIHWYLYYNIYVFKNRIIVSNRKMFYSGVPIFMIIIFNYATSVNCENVFNLGNFVKKEI